MKNGKEKQDYLLKRINQLQLKEFTVTDLWENIFSEFYEIALIEKERAVKKRVSIFDNINSVRRALNSLVMRKLLKTKLITKALSRGPKKITVRLYEI